MDGWQSEVWRLLNGEKGKKGKGTEIMDNMGG